MNMSLPLTHKVTVTFALFAAAIVAWVAVFAYVSGRDSLEKATVAGLLSKANEKGDALTNWISIQLSAVAPIAASPHLIDNFTALGDAAPNSSEARAAHAALVRTLQPHVNRQYLELFLLEPKTGMVIASTDPGEEGTFKENRAYFVHGKKGPYVQNVNYSLKLGSPSMFVSSPVISPGGVLLGVLAARLNLDQMNSIVSRGTEVYPSEAAFLVDTSNLLVTLPRFVTDTGAPKGGIRTAAVNRCLAESSGVVSADNYRGVPSIAVYRWLPQYQLCLVVERERPEALAGIQSFRLEMILIGGLTLAVALVLSLGLTRWVVRPIKELADTADAIRNGDLSQQAKVATRDEVGTLARAFNSMTDQLRAMIGSLEERVAERTQELQASTDEMAVVDGVARIMTSTLDIDDIYEQFAMEVKKLVDFDRIAVLVIEGDAGSYVVKQFSGPRRRGPRPGDITELDGSQIQQILATGQTSVRADIGADPRFVADQDYVDEGLLSSIMVPLFSEGVGVGALSLRSRRPGAFGLREQRILERLASQIAPAVENARLYEERSLAEEAARSSQQRLSGILNTADEAIISVDEGQLITDVNNSAEMVFGYQQHELLGAPVHILLPSRFAETHGAHIREFAGSGDHARMMNARGDVIGLRKDGTEFPAEASISRLEFQGQKVFTVILRDVTERKLAEVELSRKTAELERSNAELGQFAYVASHDLQEPLRMVTSYTQMLGRRYCGRLDADADEFISYAVDGSLRMQKLIDGLLAYSRLGSLGLEPEMVDCSTVFDQATANLKIAIDEAGAEVTRDALPAVTADATQLGQLFQNLVGNAIKFRGREPPRVHVSAERRGGEWLFCVSDNGIGIAPQYADRIFVIFQRLQSAGEYPGTGMGLTICKKIVELHSGRIWVESEPGVGATFYFTLPVCLP